MTTPQIRKSISIIAPMYNEEKLVAEYCRQVELAMAPLADRYDYTIIMVDDGSRDATLQEMERVRTAAPQRYGVVRLSRNFGLEGAIFAGLGVADGDAVVVMDADLQDPPSLIPKMVTEWENGADVVNAVRTSREHDNLFKRCSANLFYRLLSSLSGKIPIRPGAANFRLLNRKALDAMQGLPESNPVFRVVTPFLGMTIREIEYSRDPRYAGKTKYSLTNMIPYALDSLTGISVLPLRKLYLSIVFSAMLLALFSVLAAVYWSGVFFISAVVSLFACVFALSITIMGEYLAQIMVETKGRPLAIVYESHLPKKERQS